EVFEIPIRVMAIEDVLINVESNLGTLRPDSTITLQYSLEHKGNVELDLTPSFELPGGWSVASSLEVVNLPWATSKNLLYTLEAGSNARSGTVKLHLDNGSSRFTWTGQLNVEALPEPTLTFVSLELQDGTTFTNPQGSGTHPSGENLKFTWLLSNEAETVWNPSASLRLDAGLFGDCTPVEPVGKGDVSPVVCNLVIDRDMAPMSEPSFTVILNDGGIEETTTVGLLVATNEQVAWDLDAVPLFTTGQEREITVEITNVGNTPFQRQLVVGAPEAWSASIDGEDIVDLDVGQSSLMRISLRADSPGEASISLTLAQSPASEATYSFTVTSSGEPIGTSSESGLNSALTVGLLVLVLLVAFGFLGAQVIRNRNGPRPTSAAPAFHPVLPVPAAQSPAVPLAPQPASPVPAKVPAAPSAPPATAPPPMCWTCRQPVTTAMIGCPSCGARYHADGFNGCGAHEIETCVNCGAASSTFVDA
ncbi:MAG: hypothetical protein VYE72_00200, partial [Candidatus Thermoplasmatota archaeon]|nr:hypothetical protein [Candidatus Thermoplasmatota archaeon]